MEIANAHHKIPTVIVACGTPRASDWTVQRKPTDVALAKTTEIDGDEGGV